MNLEPVNLPDVLQVLNLRKEDEKCTILGEGIFMPQLLICKCLHTDKVWFFLYKLVATSQVVLGGIKWEN